MSNKIEFKFSNINEQDIDLLIIEEIANNKNFSDVFLKTIHVVDYEILEITHSESRSYFGETDIQVIYVEANIRKALLIEDKINAIAMPEQASRYQKRGKELVRKGIVSSYDIFICAPRSYLNSNSEASKYPNQVAYEQLLELYIGLDDTRSNFKREVLRFALDKKNRAYDPIVDENVTAFWSQLYDHMKLNYPSFIFNRVKGGRGGDANWPMFSTNNSNVHIYFKSDKGYVDLSINCNSENFIDLKQILKKMVDSDMLVVKTNKSISVRLNTPIVDFGKRFENQLEEVNINLEAINRLYDFNDKIEKMILKFTNSKM